MRDGRLRIVSLLSALCIGGTTAYAEDEPANAGPADLAQQLLHPVASLVSMPFESNFNFDADPAHATSPTGNFKPVIPFFLATDWKFIARTIMPFISTQSPDLDGRSASGVGDITAMAYLSPNAAACDWNWGAGPALTMPSATDSSIGSGNWSAGPTAAALRLQGSWTFVTIVGHA